MTVEPRCCVTTGIYVKRNDDICYILWAQISLARLSLWTISLALESADCGLYCKTTWLENIKRRVGEMRIKMRIIMMLSYNVSLYGLVFLSVSGFSLMT